MSDRIEPMTHIDIRVVKNLLMSRVNEGRDIIKTSSVSQEWKQKERQFQEKCRQAIRLIDEAISIKEGKYDVSKTSSKNTAEGYQGIRETGIQNQKDKA